MKVVVFLFGDSPTSEFYVPTFRNTLFHLHRWCKQEESYSPVFREIIVSSSPGSHSPRKITNVSGIVMSSFSGSGSPRKVTDVSGTVMSSISGSHSPRKVTDVSRDYRFLMNDPRIPETSVTVHRSTQRNILEYLNLKRHRCESLKIAELSLTAVLCKENDGECYEEEA